MSEYDGHGDAYKDASMTKGNKESYDPSPLPSNPRKKSGRRGNRRNDPSKQNKAEQNFLHDFTGSAAGVDGIDRHENPLYQVPIDSSGAVSFGNWPYPGQGLYGLGYNYKPIVSVVMPVLLIAGLALLFPGVINAARYGRRKRSVNPTLAEEPEDQLNSIHETVLAATHTCWQRFACETQHAVQGYSFLNGIFGQDLGGQISEVFVTEDRTGETETQSRPCEEFECSYLGDLFHS